MCPRFPSPSGVSHFSMYNRDIMRPVRYCFRPLPGYLISQYCRKSNNTTIPIVSVPFRGISFLNPFFNGKSQIYMVSVPFRGISFLNPFVTIKQQEDTVVSVPFRGISFLNYVYGESENGFVFPSPSGVSHFSIVYLVELITDPEVSFRPLPGYLISQYREGTHSKYRFPSPSGVSHFSMKSILITEMSFQRVSVPFRGISFLNVVIWPWMKPKKQSFPSPSGVSHFSMN